MFEPIPEILAPMETSMRQRSWMCGSEAAFSMVVLPSARTAAMRAFSVAVTDASSRKRPAPFSPSVCMVKNVPISTRVPSSMSARKWVSIGRRPIPSPPGGGRRTLPFRARSGPANRMEARIFCARSAGISSRLMSRHWNRQELGPSLVAEQPRTLRISIMT